MISKTKKIRKELNVLIAQSAQKPTANQIWRKYHEQIIQQVFQHTSPIGLKK